MCGKSAVFRVALWIAAALLFGLMPSILPAAQESEPITVTDADGEEVVINDPSRIVSLSGRTTEILYALGLGDRLIGVDVSSIYPAEAAELPQVGYIRFLEAEAVLAVEPTLIIATTDIGPVEVVEQLRQSGITLLIVPAEDTLEGAVATIELLAQALGADEAGADIAAELLTDAQQAQALVETVETTPRVLFVYAREGILAVAGTDTGADEIIRLAGGENVVTEFEGYQPITAELIAAYAPDIILTTSLGVESLGGLEGFLQIPGLAQTPAAQNNRIIYENLDDLYLLGFTPRLGNAILDLTYLLHESLPRPIPVVWRLRAGEDILTQAMTIGGMDVTLSGEGPFTVFAPTAEAFEALPEGLLEGLFSSPISVQAVIAFHVLPGRYTSEDLAALDGQSVNSLLGQPLNVTVADGMIYINEIPVLEADIEASNGIIHVVGGALIPQRPE
jgi:iron complex transport system substrate-binding protein